MPARKVSLNSTPKEKPSLASLKPDKTRGVAARKRAVKKIEAGMTTKVSTTKITKKAGEKKVVLKRATRKTKAPTLDIVERTEFLVLPQNMSIRAREKALVILEKVTKDFEHSARQVAYISGLCFVLLGASMSLAFTTPFSTISDQQAELISATGSTTETISQTAAKALAPKPTYTLLDPLPVEATSKTTHRLDVTNAKHVDVKVFGVNNTTQVGLQVDDITHERFEFEVNPESLEPGEYIAKVYVVSDIDDSKHFFRLGEFVVPYPPAAAGTESEATDANSADDAALVETEDAASEEETLAEPAEAITPSLRLFTPHSVLSGKLALKITASVPVTGVRLDMRPIKSIMKTPLGSAELRNGAWYYFFNTEVYADGEYELIANSRFNDETIRSNSIKIKIANNVVAPTEASETGAAETPLVNQVPVLEPEFHNEAELADTEATSAQTTPLRTFSEFSLDEVADFSSSSVRITQTASAEVDTVFVSYRDELRELLRRYAVAQQSGDPVMLDLAHKSLEETKQRLVGGILSNSETNELADDIDDELNARFDMLKKRIDTFEELRRTASNNESAADKDRDGVSDYDEKFLFATNPDDPDTDDDGILDGVEIMGGFNPADPSAEAVIEYEMPQQSLALVENELLKVEAVAPVMRNDINEQNPEVQAEIRGKGLPNSYVTIYIFSTPTIVTVRTDQDGSFVYTFEKELEDGEHEVYVAVTDNTGGIVAQSSPFKFVKEAQAFTPVDENEPVATTELATYSLQSVSMYNVIVGLGILALGLILLMLGVGLRERDKMINPVPSNDLKAT